MAETRPPRDPITQDSTGAKASPKRSDLLNNKPRTTSAGSKGPAFTTGDDKTSAPCPSDPYDDE